MITVLYKTNVQWKCLNLQHRNVLVVLYELYTSHKIYTAKIGTRYQISWGSELSGLYSAKKIYTMPKLDLDTRDHQDLSSVLIAALYKANIQRKCIVLKHNNVIMVLYGLYTSNDKLAMMMILIMIMMKLMILMTTMIFTASMICTMCIIDCIDYDYIDDINDIKSTMPTLLIMTMIFMTRLLWQQWGYWW